MDVNNRIYIYIPDSLKVRSRLRGTHKQTHKSTVILNSVPQNNTDCETMTPSD